MALSSWLFTMISSMLMMYHMLVSTTVAFEIPRRSTGATSRSWQNAVDQANLFISQLNLTEKASMVTGAARNGNNACIGNIIAIPRLNFSGLCLGDGPAGYNRQDLVSVFPSGVTTAATWDKSLMFARGIAIGEEFRDKGAHIALGPVAGPLGRHPLGGRNWEGFSPDPYLTGKAMNETIVGMQSIGVQACAKHYIGNEQETQRSSSVSSTGVTIDGISSNIDDRTLHELYLWPFADAVRAGTSSVMCSYNRLNETYSCQNSVILNDILKTELGFQGYVMSDFFATHSGSDSINAGLDMSMPGPLDQATETLGRTESFFGGNITNYLVEESITEVRLDDMIRRIMTPYYYLRQDQAYPSIDPATTAALAVNEGLPLSFLGLTTAPEARDVRGNHSALIREIGSAGIVLLKNNATLPLQNPKSIGVFGNGAADLKDGFTQTFPQPPFGYEFGTLDIGGGSGTVRHTTLVPPLDAIKAKAKQIGARVEYITNNVMLAAGEFESIYPVMDVCLVFLKTYAQEGYDRLSFENDWNSTYVVESVANMCENTVVITQSSGVNTLPWASLVNVKAILAAHYGGEEAGNSIVDILWGDAEPSGRLPYTIPANASDYDIPVVNITDETDPNGWQSNFTEGLLIDYRHFDAFNITPLYEFGYGLSYTTFELACDMKVEHIEQNLTEAPDPQSPVAPGGVADLYTHILTASMTVTNTGSRAGYAVPQLYISFTKCSNIPPHTPQKVLRGFEKLYLQPNQTQDVNFEISRRDISYWDTVSQRWLIPRGEIQLLGGFSSRFLPNEASVVLLSV